LVPSKVKFALLDTAVFPEFKKRIWFAPESEAFVPPVESPTVPEYEVVIDVAPVPVTAPESVMVWLPVRHEGQVTAFVETEYVSGAEKVVVAV
jgi:hypothetical protein